PVAEAEQPVLAPAVRAAARVVVREIVPGRPVLGVVLADRSPLPLGEIGPPALPVALSPRVLSEPLCLGRFRGNLPGRPRRRRSLRRLGHIRSAYGKSHRGATSQKTLIAPFAPLKCSKS